MLGVTSLTGCSSKETTSTSGTSTDKETTVAPTTKETTELTEATEEQTKTTVEQPEEIEEQPEVISIGSIIGTISSIAYEQGFFEEEFSKDGIKVEFSTFTAGPNVTEAFISDSLDFATYGDQPAIVAVANGVGITAIGTFTGGYDKLALLAGTNSGITKVKDIKGKKVGITVGTVVQHMLYLYLESVGLKAEDVEVVNLQPNDIITSLVTGDIDAAVTVEPFTTVAVAKNAGVQIADSTDLKFFAGPIVVDNEFAKKYPQIVERILTVYDKAKKWEAENPDSAADILATELNVPVTIVKAGIISKDTDNVLLGEDAIKAFAQTYQFLRANEIITKDYDITTFYDIKYLEAAGLQ
jgi:sulfonate transport system substrate-binding protein